MFSYNNSGQYALFIDPTLHADFAQNIGIIVVWPHMHEIIVVWPHVQDINNFTGNITHEYSHHSVDSLLCY